MGQAGFLAMTPVQRQAAVFLGYEQLSWDDAFSESYSAETGDEKGQSGPRFSNGGGGGSGETGLIATTRGMMTEKSDATVATGGDGNGDCIGNGEERAHGEWAVEGEAAGGSSVPPLTAAEKLGCPGTLAPEYERGRAISLLLKIETGRGKRGA